MLRDGQGELAWTKVVVFTLVMGTFAAWIGVNVGIAAGWWPWERFSGSMQWGSGAFLGGAVTLLIGHRATFKTEAKGDDR